MKRVSIALSSIIFTLSAYTADNVDGNSFYLKAGGGISYLRSKLDQDYYPDVKFPDSTFVSVGVGYVFNDSFRSDVELTLRSLRQLVHARQYLTEDGNSTEEIKQNFSNSTLMLNGYYTIYKSQHFSPYVMGGVGLSKHHLGDYFSKDVLTESSTTLLVRSSTSNTNISPALSLGIGSTFHVSQNLDIDVLYKYVYLGKTSAFKIVETVNGGDTEIHKISPGKFKSHELGLNIILKL